MDLLKSFFKPEIFWSSILTLLSLFIISFIIHIYKEINKINKIKKFLDKELEDNYLKIKNIASNDDIQLPDSLIITRAMNNFASSEHIKTEIWEKYKFQLSNENPKLFEKYKEFYLYIESIIKDRSHNNSLEIIRSIDSAKSFVDLYNTTY